MIIKRPNQIRQRQLGTTTFATGRANLNSTNPAPKSCGMGAHARHEMREHRGRRY